jgi:hypothetical protein
MKRYYSKRVYIDETLVIATIYRSKLPIMDDNVKHGRVRIHSKHWSFGWSRWRLKVYFKKAHKWADKIIKELEENECHIGI